MIIASCQRLLNERIAASTAARDQLEELRDCSFAVEIAGSGQRLTLYAEDGRVRCTAAPDAPADATLRATPLDLLTLMRSNSLTDLKRTDAHLEGKLHVAEGFADLLKRAAPDLEAELADWVGDIAAHEIGQTARGLIAWTRHAGRALELNTAEYLTEESPMLMPSTRLKSFADEVDRLRDDVERTIRRVELLERAQRLRDA